jgi:hypothetical protein
VDLGAAGGPERGRQPATGGRPLRGLALLAPLLCVFGVFSILATAFWVWMLIDALQKEPTTNDQILWFLVLFFLHLLGR